MRNTDRVRTTHVGSLPRPAELRAFLAQQQEGLRCDEAAYVACLRDSVADIVRKQVQTGIDIVNDGEFGKINWSIYIRERLGGVTRRSDPPGKRALTHTQSRDRRQFAEFYAGYDRAVTTPLKYEGWVADGPLTYRGEAIARDIDNLKAALNGAAAEGFLPVRGAGQRT